MKRQDERRKDRTREEGEDHECKPEATTTIDDDNDDDTQDDDNDDDRR